jgi:hypothetical protein
MSRKRKCEACTEVSITVAAPQQTVLKVASDASLVAEWSGECRDCVKKDCPNLEHSLLSTQCFLFECHSPRGARVDWHLALSEQTAGTKVTASIDPELSPSRPMKWFRRIWPQRDHCVVNMQAGLGRVKWAIEAPDRVAKTPDRVVKAAEAEDLGTDNLLTLLNIYTTQFGSYTTLLWQVPALGLTAQAFLLMIALGSSGTSNAARWTAAGLSMIIALASRFLMHNQRGRAINQAELAKRLSYMLSMKDFLGSFELDDAVPKKTNAQDVWSVDHWIYQGWGLCMLLFIAADAAVLASLVFFHNAWF